METIYLPKHLLMSFFHEKPIHYTFQPPSPEVPNPQYNVGALDLTVHVDGSCRIRILDSSSKFGATASVGIDVDSAMLDRISWDGEKFVGIFEKVA